MPMPMDIHHRYSFLSILTLSLPLFCLLLSWVSSAIITTAPPFHPPSTSSSVLAAANDLRTRGYSLFASTLISTNLSGTILAPPDFAFSFATAKFSPNSVRRAPPRLSANLVLYHALQPPSLAWINLTSRPNGDELQTFYNNRCLFILKNPNGDVSLSTSKKPLQAVTIRQPDLYLDENLIVHGIDGVLDPISAAKCSSKSNKYPMDDQIRTRADRSFLDHAIRVLRRRGFQVVATAMALKRVELLTLTAVTIFAPLDRTLFSQPGGFRYDFHNHVVPRRLRFSDLVTNLDGEEFETSASNKTVFVQSSGEAISVNGVIVDGAELYHNRWIVLYSVSTTLDDASAQFPAPLPETHFPGDMSDWVGGDENGSGAPSAAPASTGESIEEQHPSAMTQIPGDVARAVAPMSGHDHIHDKTGESTGPPSPLPSPEVHVPAEISPGVPEITPVNRQELLRDVSGELSVPPTLSWERYMATEVPLGVPGVAPINGEEQVLDVTAEPIDVTPSLSPETESHIATEVSHGVPLVAPVGGQEHLQGVTGESMGPSSLPASPIREMKDIFERQCAEEGQNDGVPAVTVGVEGADLFCPVNTHEELARGGVIEGF